MLFFIEEAIAAGNLWVWVDDITAFEGLEFFPECWRDTLYRTAPNSNH
jgi:hypothetical protein